MHALARAVSCIRCSSMSIFSCAASPKALLGLCCRLGAGPPLYTSLPNGRAPCVASLPMLTWQPSMTSGCPSGSGTASSAPSASTSPMYAHHLDRGVKSDGLLSVRYQPHELFFLIPAEISLLSAVCCELCASCQSSSCCRP